jgi:hypothetical protein
MRARGRGRRILYLLGWRTCCDGCDKQVRRTKPDFHGTGLYCRRCVRYANRVMGMFD